MMDTETSDSSGEEGDFRAVEPQAVGPLLRNSHPEDCSETTLVFPPQCYLLIADHRSAFPHEPRTTDETKEQ